MARLLEHVFQEYLDDPGKLEADLFEDLELNQENVIPAKFRHAASATKWAVLASIADSHYRTQKEHAEGEVWSSACIAARKEIEQFGKKSAQYEVIEKANLDPAYRRAKALLRKLGHVLDIIKKVESGFWHRKTMLEAISDRDRREEFAAPRPRKSSELSEHISDSLSNGNGSKKEEDEKKLLSMEEKARQKILKAREKVACP